MGPRLGGRGDVATGGFASALQLASMGPRLGGRGDGLSPHAEDVGVAVLQWGRGSVAAETGEAQAAYAASIGSFNGAAARWPRRPRQASRTVHMWVCGLQWGRGSVAAETREITMSIYIDDQLQWGRGSVAAETHWDSVYPAKSRSASMGPRLGGRGDCGRRTSSGWRPWSFNGAAARWPRRLETGLSGHQTRESFNGAAARWPRRRLSPFGNGFQ